MSTFVQQFDRLGREQSTSNEKEISHGNLVRPSFNEASALGFRLCKVCGARLLLDR
jgi:hypothetical protein